MTYTDNCIGLELGSYNYSHIIKLNPLLGGNNSLFGSNYFSIEDHNCVREIKEAKKY